MASRPGVSSRGFLQNLAHDRRISFTNFDKAYPGGLVGGNFRGLQPVAAGVLVEIHAGIDGFVDRVGIERWAEIGRKLLAASNKRNAGKKRIKRMEDLIGMDRRF